MTYFRDYSPSRDGNENVVIARFEHHGAFVVKAQDIDLFVNLYGEWFAVEVKMPGKRLEKHQLNIQERCGSSYVARSALDVDAIVQDRKDRIAKRRDGVPVH